MMTPYNSQDSDMYQDYSYNDDDDENANLFDKSNFKSKPIYRRDIKEKPEITIPCDICNIDFWCQSSYELHIQGKLHQRQINALSLFHELKSNPPRGVDLVNMHCVACNTPLSSFDTVKAHVLGKKHNKNLEVWNDGNVAHVGPNGIRQTNAPKGLFTCHVCVVSMNSEEGFQQHLNGAKHKNKMAQKDAARQGWGDGRGGGIYPGGYNGMHRGQQGGYMMQRTTTSTVMPSWGPNSGGPPAKGQKYNCHTCEVTLSSLQQYEQHVGSLKHLTKVSGNQDMGEDFSADMNFSNGNSKKKRQHDAPDGPSGQKSVFECHTCNITCSSKDALEAHFNGKKHKSKATFGNLSNDQRSEAFPRPNPGAPDGNVEKQVYCDICDIYLSSDIVYYQHVIGKKHKAVLSGEEPKPKKKKVGNFAPNTNGSYMEAMGDIRYPGNGYGAGGTPLGFGNSGPAGRQGGRGGRGGGFNRTANVAYPNMPSLLGMSPRGPRNQARGYGYGEPEPEPFAPSFASLYRYVNRK